LLQAIAPFVQALLDLLKKNPQAAHAYLKAKGCSDEMCAAVCKTHKSLEASAEALLTQCEACEAVCAAAGCPCPDEG
jgi:hypothetical protein